MGGGEEEGGVCGGGGRARCLVLQIIASPAEMCDQDSQRKEKKYQASDFLYFSFSIYFFKYFISPTFN